MRKPKSFEVWDWIVTHKNEVRQITHDEMNDLKYENIKRRAMPKEIKIAKAKIIRTKKVKNNAKSDPTLKDILVLGKFSDDVVRQIIVAPSQVDGITELIRLTSPNQIVQVLDEELYIDFSRNPIPITQTITKL